MSRKILWAVLLVLSLSSSPVLAVEGDAATGSVKPAKMCPCGMALHEEAMVTVEHNGKTYELCATCAKLFEADPEGVVEQLEAAEEAAEDAGIPAEAMQE